MKIQVKHTGYYDGINNKVHLLHEGDTLELVEVATDFEAPRDSWKCKMADGRSVFIEFHNGKQVVVS